MFSKSLFTTLLFAVGCAQPATSTSPAQATATVERVFIALGAQDCQSLDTLLGGKIAASMQKKGCAKTLETDPLSKTTLISAQNPRQDGRDSKAWMVDVILRKGEKAYPTTVRLEQTEHGLRVVSM